MPEHPLFGSVPNGWESAVLGEICARNGGTIQTGPFGSQLHASDYVAEGTPVVMPQNIGDNRISDEGIARITDADADRLRRHRLHAGDIVYSRRGDVERRALVRPEEDGWLCGTGCLRIQLGSDGLDPVYLSQYLAHPVVRAWIVRHAVGATMPNLNTGILAAVPVLVPPENQQAEIGRFLGGIDDKLRLIERLNATLEATAGALFATLLEQARQDAAPQPLSDVLDINPRRSLRKGEAAPYLDMQHMPTRGHRAMSWNPSRPFASGTRFINGDTLMARITPCLENGKTAFVDFLDEGTVGWGSTEYIVLRPKEPLSPEFAYFLARTPELRDHAVQNMTGSSGRRRVSAEAIGRFEVGVPPADTAAAFAEAVRPLMASVRCNAAEYRHLVETRDALLPRLVTGSLSITPREQMLA